MSDTPEAQAPAVQVAPDLNVHNSLLQDKWLQAEADVCGLTAHSITLQRAVNEQAQTIATVTAERDELKEELEKLKSKGKRT